MCKLEVNIKSAQKNYPIFINNHDIEKLKDEIFDYIGDKNFVVIISREVYKLYSNILKFPKEKIFILKDGEKEKNIKNYAKILDFTLKNHLTREDAIIAIGGGVVGDLAGFVASTYMRGINYIQVPTTLLACTDSSVGGKTAINTSYGKNLVGSFYQPNSVFINVNFLKTLDERQFKSGLGEVIKYGFIEKSFLCNEELNLMNFLNENAQKILDCDILTLADLIKICIKLKISVVNQDEKEKGLRKILNYGHTYGHAIEKITNYRKYTHGECVICGILFALNFAFKNGKIDKEYKFLCEDLVSKFNFPKIPQFDTNKILNIMKTDKKAGNNYITLILPTDYAKVEPFKYNFDQINL
ncbi:3-dehydroquinate synthase [bacterium]|nr:3-dehydroquinate synthase [bacterium]